MPLAFTQEDFLVSFLFIVASGANIANFGYFAKKPMRLSNGRIIRMRYIWVAIATMSS